MEDFDLEYLRSLNEEVLAKQNKFIYFEPDETDAQISYIPSKLRIYWPGRMGSPLFRHEMESSGVSEKSKLRKDAKNYFRIVRKDGRILRIDSYIQGRLTVIDLAYYEGDRRYFFPFSSTGHIYPTYICVVRFENGFVTEDYMVSTGQIIYRAYRQMNSEEIEMRRINYLPISEDHPINYKSQGFFKTGDKLNYTETYHWSEWDDN